LEKEGIFVFQNHYFIKSQDQKIGLGESSCRTSDSGKPSQASFLSANAAHIAIDVVINFGLLS
jgi:hypothetical protein